MHCKDDNEVTYNPATLDGDFDGTVAVDVLTPKAYDVSTDSFILSSSVSSIGLFI